jgi:DnaJ-domain-containing protein 1
MDDTMPGNSKQTSSSQGSSGASSSSNKVPANSVYQAYQTLQVELHTPPDLVKKQFRKLTLSYHPDLPNGSEEKMKALVNAYDEIKRYWQTSAHAL